MTGKPQEEVGGGGGTVANVPNASSNDFGDDRGLTYLRDLCFLNSCCVLPQPPVEKDRDVGGAVGYGVTVAVVDPYDDDV